MDNINFELYKVFYYVAKNRNITKAAEMLLISQPAITQTIKKLEGELNYQLFYRTSRGMELTDQGEKLYASIKNSIECLNSCKRTLDNNFGMLKNKSIRIGGGVTLLKHNALYGFERFKERYPEMKIEIVKGITSDLLKKLYNNSIDLVLFNMPIEIDENIECEIIESFQDVFVANTDYFKEYKDKVFNIKDLNTLPLVLQSDVSSSRKFLNSICNKNKVILKEEYNLESYDLVLNFVKAGLGVGFVNRNHIINELKKGELFELNIDYNIPERQIGIAYSKKNINNEYIRKFIDILKIKNE